MGFLNAVFGDWNSRELKKIEKIADEVEALQEGMQKLSDDELKAKTPEFKERLKNGETLDDLLPEAFAVCHAGVADVAEILRQGEEVVVAATLAPGAMVGTDEEDVVELETLGFMRGENGDGVGGGGEGTGIFDRGVGGAVVVDHLDEIGEFRRGSGGGAMFLHGFAKDGELVKEVEGFEGGQVGAVEGEEGRGVAVEGESAEEVGKEFFERGVEGVDGEGGEEVGELYKLRVGGVRQRVEGGFAVETSFADGVEGGMAVELPEGEGQDFRQIVEAAAAGGERVGEAGKENELGDAAVFEDVFALDVGDGDVFRVEVGEEREGVFMLWR